MVLASDMVQKLNELIEKYGDHPVMFFIEDDGSYDVELPKFDTDGRGDICYMI